MVASARYASQAIAAKMASADRAREPFFNGFSDGGVSARSSNFFTANACVTRSSTGYIALR